MPSYITALIHALLLSSVVAFPATVPASEPKSRSFKVKRIPNANFGGHDGTAALIKSYKKWGMEVPSGLEERVALKKRHKVKGGVAEVNAALVGALGLNAVEGGPHTHTRTRTHYVTATAPPGTSPSPTGTVSNGTASNGAGVGEVTATPEASDVEYLSPVTIGGQTLNMDFDTGSSDLWVFSTSLPMASQQGHTPFDSAKSTTFQLMQGSNFSISYGDGSAASGIVGTDTVNIGGATVTSQAVELATAVSGSFTLDNNNNGLVGLAYSKLNTVKPTKQKTFFDNAMATLPEPLFTANLKAGQAGTYEFGAIDSTQFNGPLSWAAVNTVNGFWQFSSTKFSVNNGPQTPEPNGQAIADTGTTLMLVSTAIVNAYYSQVNGAVNDATVGGITFPCNSILPDLQVDIGGNYMANIPGHVINYAKVDPAGQTCFGGVQATSSSLQIYGDILFKAQFVVFNGGNNSIAMAPHN